MQIIIYDLLPSISPYISDYTLGLKSVTYIPTKSCMNAMLRLFSFLIQEDLSSGIEYPKGFAALWSYNSAQCWDLFLIL